MQTIKPRIYLLKDLKPEVRAVAFAKCSRSPEPFDEIAKELTEESSAKFHEKWVVGYGHGSVAEHAVLSIAIENVSILATKVIEDCRLNSFTEKSTRYQIFNKERCYYPENVMNSEYAEVYKNAIETYFSAYESSYPIVRKYIEEKFPRTPEQSDRQYEANTHSRVCDIIRYLLPCSTLTNLGLTINARNLEYMLIKLLSHSLAEMNEIGETVKKIAVEETPTLIQFAAKNDFMVQTKLALADLYNKNFPEKISANNEPVEIVDYDKDAENKLVACLLYPYSDLPYKLIKEKVDKMSSAEKENIIDESLKRRGPFDRPLRELEHIYYTFDIFMDYGAFRDIQRHRMCTQSNQKVTVVNGFDMPKEFDQLGIKDKFINAMDVAKNAYEKISAKFPNEAQYVVPLAYKKRVLITWSLRELHHFISLRTGKKGHPSYRHIAQLCWKKLNEIHPLLAKYIRSDMDEETSSWAATLFTSPANSKQ